MRYSGDVRVLRLLESVDAFQTNDHFVFASGLHSDVFVNKNATYPRTRVIRRIAEYMGEMVLNDGIEAVVGPATGGITLAFCIADYLTEQRGEEVLNFYADKVEENDFHIRRGYDKLLRGKRTLVVDDLVTSGGSLRKVVIEAQNIGADVHTAMAMCNRGSVQRSATAAPRFLSSLDLLLRQWTELECPLCRAHVPVNEEYGHGKKFVAERGR